MEIKKVLRGQMKRLLAAMDDSERDEAASAAFANLAGEPMWRECRSLLIFMSMTHEVNTEAVVKAALDDDKAVFIPRVAGRSLEFRALRGVGEASAAGQGSAGAGLFGIREPPASAPQWELCASPEPVLVIVPGLAFDEYGRRLGRGGGYYDRFMASVRGRAAVVRLETPLFAGLAFRNQVVENVPAEAHDALLDALITDARIHLFNRC